MRLGCCGWMWLEAQLAVSRVTVRFISSLFSSSQRGRMSRLYIILLLLLLLLLLLFLFLIIFVISHSLPLSRLIP